MFTRLSLLCLLAAGCCFGVTSAMVVTGHASIDETNYPLQIMRAFVPGEISNCPQGVIDGTPIVTQANVTNRWSPASSVMLSEIALLIPTLTHGTTVTITWQNQASCNTTALIKSEMQDASYDFDASMDLTNGSTISAATAATMLAAGDYTVVYGGTIAQTIKLRNDAQSTTCNGHACSIYDIGFDSNKVIRGSYYVTFWPGSHRAKIRFNLEIINSQSMKNETYSAVFKAGAASPTTVYTRSSFLHPAATRWTIQNVNGTTSDSGIWTGGAAPAVISIDHNFEYLIATKLVANYDRTRGTAINMTTNYSAWNAVTHVPFVVVGGFSGLWQALGSSTGDSEQLGPVPLWVNNWLYTQDKRAFEIMIAQADLAGSYPYHWMEGDVTKVMTKSGANGCPFACSANGNGYPITIVGRPHFFSLTTAPYSASTTIGSGTDLITSVGTVGGGAFENDISHTFEAHSTPYIVTGDPYFLEEMNYWSAYVIANYNPVGTGRLTGNTATFGWRQVRADGRMLLSMAMNWAVAPDGDPFKSYLYTALYEGIAGMEGKHGITGTSFQGNPSWNHGYNTQRVSAACGGIAVESPLHLWDIGISPAIDASIETSVAQCESSGWMEGINMIGLGRATDLGLPTAALQEWFAYRFITQLTIGGASPSASDMAIRWLSSNYREPSTSATDWFPTWTAALPGWDASIQMSTDWIGAQQYAQYIMAAAAYSSTYTAGYPAGEDGPAAWAWIKSETLDRVGWTFLSGSSFETDTRYVIIPRSAATPPAPAPTLISGAGSFSGAMGVQ